MNLDVDMSGRIEETNKPTVLAIAGSGFAYAVLISAADKRLAIDTLSRYKQKRSRKQIHIMMFASLLFLLLKEQSLRGKTIYVDDEYPAHGALIKDKVLTMLRGIGIEIDKHQIVIALVGKGSPSHEAAYEVFSGSQQPDKMISAADVIALGK
jgi:hypothetical protein